MNTRNVITGIPASSARVGKISTASTSSFLESPLWRELEAGDVNASIKGNAGPEEFAGDVTPGMETSRGMRRATSKTVCLHHSPISPSCHPKGQIIQFFFHEVQIIIFVM